MVCRLLIESAATAGRTTMVSMTVLGRTFRFASMRKMSPTRLMIIRKLTRLKMIEGTLAKSLTSGRKTPELNPGRTLIVKTVELTVIGSVTSAESITIVNEAMTRGRVLAQGRLPLVAPVRLYPALAKNLMIEMLLPIKVERFPRVITKTSVVIISAMSVMYVFAMFRFMPLRLCPGSRPVTVNSLGGDHSPSGDSVVGASDDSYGRDGDEVSSSDESVSDTAGKYEA